jgi:hypothetical protein
MVPRHLGALVILYVFVKLLKKSKNSEFQKKNQNFPKDKE